MKTVALTFPRAIAASKIVELDKIDARLNFSQYVGDKDFAIVLKSDGEYELTDNTREAVILANGNKEYVRGDRPISSKVKEIVEQWLKVRYSEYETPSETSETTQSPAPKTDPIKTVGDEKTAVKEALKAAFGSQIPNNVGIQLVKVDPKEKIVVEYKLKNGVMAGLTLSELKLFSLIFRATEELIKNENLQGISMVIKEGVIGPVNAYMPFSINEIEEVIKLHTIQ